MYVHISLLFLLSQVTTIHSTPFCVYYLSCWMFTSVGFPVAMLLLLLLPPVVLVGLSARSLSLFSTPCWLCVMMMGIVIQKVDKKTKQNKLTKKRTFRWKITLRRNTFQAMLWAHLWFLSHTHPPTACLPAGTLCKFGKRKYKLDEWHKKRHFWDLINFLVRSFLTHPRDRDRAQAHGQEYRRRRLRKT